MSQLTKIYNDSAERRQQSLSFVGRERREFELLLRYDSEQEARNAAFMAGAQNIKDVKHLA